MKIIIKGRGTSGNVPQPPAPQPPAPQPDLEKTLDRLLKITELQAKSYRKGTSVHPYYTERVANEIKEVVDTVTTRGCPIEYYIHGVLQATVYNRWSQGKKYLLDHCDPEGVYATKLKLVKIERTQRGVMVSPIPVAGILMETANTEWKRELDEFLADSTVPQFHRVGLPLTVDDLRYVASLIQPRESEFVSNISLTEIFVARLACFASELGQLNDNKPDLV